VKSVATALVAFALVALAPTGGAPSQARGAAAESTARVLAANAVEAPTIARLNAVRRAHRLHPVRLSAQLAQAARAHAASMGARGYFSHTSADGTPFAKRLARFYAHTARHFFVGESLYWRSPSAPPADVVARWLASPPHRAILLDPAWREIGLEAVRVRSAPGIFRGRAVTIVVADFGVRLS
jgi:uncharacterized protein YkwD